MAKELIKEQVIFLIKEIYAIHSAGGSLHIVLDDGNVSDDNITWCVQNSIAEEEDKNLQLLCRLCAMFLLPLTERQREKCIDQAWEEMRNHKQIMYEIDHALGEIYK